MSCATCERKLTTPYCNDFDDAWSKFCQDQDCGFEEKMELEALDDAGNRVETERIQKGAVYETRSISKKIHPH